MAVASLEHDVYGSTQTLGPKHSQLASLLHAGGTFTQ
jgi:hypothetical protein